MGKSNRLLFCDSKHIDTIATKWHIYITMDEIHGQETYKSPALKGLKNIVKGNTCHLSQSLVQEVIFLIPFQMLLFYDVPVDF